MPQNHTYSKLHTKSIDYFINNTMKYILCLLSMLQYYYQPENICKCMKILTLL